MTTSLGPRVVDELARAIRRRLLGASLIGAVIVGGWGLAPPEIVEPTVSSTERVALNVVTAAVLAVVVAWPWAHVASRRVLAPVRAWAVGNRPATAEEVRALCAQPWRQAIWILPVWAVAGVAIPALNATMVYDADAYPFVRVELQLAIAAFLAVVVAHTLVESALRPLMSRALAERPAEAVGRHGLAPRAFLIWGAVAAAPLASMAILVAGLGRDDLIRARPSIVLLGVVGLVVGGAVSSLASRPVLQGLVAAREGLDAVARGDLSVALPADRPDELGALHSGFNQMVHELRERRRIEELFGRYVGVDAAELTEEPEAGAGSRCRASILVADVIGSSRLALEFEPEEVVAMLDDFFEVVATAVDAEGGWIERFEGDGAICVFGAPVHQEDHAARAVRAAEAIRDAVAALRSHHAQLDAGIGVATGEMYVATLGAADRQSYTLVGSTNAEAARLSDLAKAVSARVLICPVTASEAGGEELASSVVGPTAPRSH